MGDEETSGLYLAETHVLWKINLIAGSRIESLTLSDLKKDEVLKFA
jgi:hypothetical protein